MSFKQGTAVLALTAVAVIAAGATAGATEDTSTQDSSSTYVIAKPSNTTKLSSLTGDEERFYETGPIDSDTLVVIPNDDGSLPGGVTEADLDAWAAGELSESDIRAMGFDTGNESRAEASRSSTVAPMSTARAYAAAPLSWSSAYNGSNIWGYDDGARVSYVFNVTLGSNQSAGGQGLGYYQGYNGSQMGVWSKWYGLGVATSGSNGGASVPWGEVLAVAKFKAKSTTIHAATGKFWS